MRHTLLKDFKKIRKTHNRSADHSLLDLNKCFRKSIRLVEFSFLQTVDDCNHNSAKFFDGPTIEGSEPLKTPHVTNDLRLGSFLNSSDFLRTRRNSISRDYKSEELNLCREKSALLRIIVQLFLPQYRTNLT